MKSAPRVGLVVLLLVVASTFVARAEQYKGDKYCGHIESTMANRLVLLTDADELVEFIVDDDATITRNAKASSLDELEQGDYGVVKATRGNGRLMAVRISVTAPE
jgi:hypothetical protein